jgi:hypothetical protein
LLTTLTGLRWQRLVISPPHLTVCQFQDAMPFEFVRGVLQRARLALALLGSH